MFSIRKYETNDEPEAKNISAWESLISDLSEPDGFDEETTTSLNDNSSNSDDATASTAGDHDFYPARLSPSKKKRASAQKEEDGNGLTRDGGTFRSNETPSSNDTMKLESPALLKDWIQHHATKYPPTVNHMGRKMSEAYVQIAASIALALARDLKGQFYCLQFEDVVVDNIRVYHCIENGEFKLERVEILPLISRNNAAADRVSQQQIERRLVLALGMVLYELFTQGNSPPARIQQSLKSKGNMLSFGAALRISDKIEEEEEGDNGDNRAVLGDYRRKNTDDDDESMNDNHSKEREEVQESFQRNQRRRRCNDREREESVPTLLKLAGVPSSITRLIADMLSNREDVDFGGLFQYDKSVACFAEVIVDLEQMVAKPTDFLFDRIRLSAKPTVRNELYSRQEELRQGMELAEKVAAGNSNYSGEGVDESFKQEVLVVSGNPGSGKSSFVNKLTTLLTDNGWGSLHCKFDQISRRQPLSTIASAFDRFFLSLLSTGGRTTTDREIDVLRDVRVKLSETFDEESFSILYHLIPNMRHVMTHNGDDSTMDMELTEYVFDHSSLISSKLLVQNLFYELLRVISTSWKRPIVFFMDDLHWADVASWELITFLIDEMGSHTSQAGTNVLIVGTVRTNEVENSNELTEFLQQIRKSYKVTVTDMTMHDLSPCDVNVMISESLCYSQRLTRSLANIVHQKTTGNCFFIKEFINDLTIENLLVYSYSERTWEWDEDLIESRTISDGVAEILSRKMLRLPKEQLSALVMLSCFGSEVSFEVLALVKSSFGYSNMIATLDCVVKARFVERTDDNYHFVHDMILHAAQEAVDEDERVMMIKDLLQALLISGYRDDNVLFIIVDLISRVGPERVHDSETRLLYAQLNLTAAEKATKATDFASASTCVKHGISFLPTSHWDNNYRLSLELFSQSALIECSLGNKEEMMKSFEEVFNNAKCFEDTLRAAHVKLNYLRMTGNCLGEAFAYGFQILEHLGETFPAAPDISMVVKEMLGTKQLLTGSLNVSVLKSLPELSDSKKKEAMAFLEEVLICSYQSQSIHFFLIACRMIHITLQYGMSKYTSLALVSVGLGFVTVFGDFSEGYTMAKTSLSISSSDRRVLNSVMVTAYGMINIWKEPIQATLPQLKDTYDMSVKYGLIDNALASGMLHAYRAFFTGSSLKPLSKEVEVFIRNNSERHKRRLIHLSTLPVSQGIWYLSGFLASQTAGDFILEEHMAEAVRNKELTVCECMLTVKMMCCFIFRRFDEIKSIARQYLDLYERNGQASAQFINIYRLFYGGLISLHFYRESKDHFWMGRAAHAIKMMELWTAESDWNFENKLFLLQAERHYGFGEINDATEKYKLAEKSSRKHRFAHEEALSCELAAAFHKQIGSDDLANELNRKAMKCYQTWGANKKVELMK